MEEHICQKFSQAIGILEETYCLCDQTLIIADIESAKAILDSTYSELKDDVYYANLICKELYCKIREARARAYELLCCAVNVLNDKGGMVDPYCFSEADELIREAICYIEKAKELLCGHCKDSCCESSCEASCESSCEASCESSCSGLYTSCGSSSYCDSSSMTSSCLTSSCLTSSCC